MFSQIYMYVLDEAFLLYIRNNPLFKLLIIKEIKEIAMKNYRSDLYEKSYLYIFYVVFLYFLINVIL